MGYHPLGALRRIDRGQMHARVQGLLDRLGVRLDPERPVRGLSIADQQIVEIAKALSFEARVLIMDEPTAALSGPEVERLFAVVRTLREEGAAVLFISHRLDEVFAICDTVTVMRDGAVVHDARIADMTPDEMVKRMVGRELSALFPKQDAEIGETVLSVHRLTREGVFFDVSFEVRAGEIVALAGLVGAGRSEVARAIFGIDKPDAGHVEVAGRRLPPGRPLTAMRAGIGFVPEDRRQQGLVMDLSVARNATMTRMGALSRLGLISGAAEDRLAREWATRLQLKFHRLVGPRGLPLGRQPAEGRARQVARDRAEAADPRRADARHRRRHEVRGPPPDGRAGEPRPRGADDLERAARGARHGRPRARHARGPADRRAQPRRRPTRRASSAPPPARSRRPPHERRRRPRRRERPGAPLHRVGLPRPRARHRRRARAADRRHRDPRAALHRDRLAAQPRAQRLDLRDPRRRADARARHAQRRPLGRLRARAERLLRRRPALQPPRHGAAARVRARDRARRGLRAAQRDPRDLGPGARARRDARDALHVPRARVRVDRRPADQRRDAARLVPQPRHRLDPRRSRSS